MAIHHPDHSVADFIVSIEAILAFAGAVLFLASYVIFFNWRKTPGGRAIAILTSAIVATQISSFLFVVFGPDYWGRDIVRIIVSLGAIAGTWGLFIALWSSWARHHTPLVAEPRTGPVGVPDRPTPTEPPSQGLE